ncbi:hypothetical protein VP01_628g2 [Puccinia sorghi]|uniref:Uncharacterized protein n=1 Tax=Puccinia sorghi TaxID=27349 RepID=A0A0L6UIG5_9BASI|nr:hypothetical protein VP01_628g2 [Puccinia sorghi]
MKRSSCLHTLNDLSFYTGISMRSDQHKIRLRSFCAIGRFRQVSQPKRWLEFIFLVPVSGLGKQPSTMQSGGADRRTARYEEAWPQELRSSDELDAERRPNLWDENLWFSRLGHQPIGWSHCSFASVMITINGCRLKIIPSVYTSMYIHFFSCYVPFLWIGGVVGSSEVASGYGDRQITSQMMIWFCSAFLGQFLRVTVFKNHDVLVLSYQNIFPSASPGRKTLSGLGIFHKSSLLLSDMLRFGQAVRKALARSTVTSWCKTGRSYLLCYCYWVGSMGFGRGERFRGTGMNEECEHLAGISPQSSWCDRLKRVDEEKGFTSSSTACGTRTIITAAGLKNMLYQNWKAIILTRGATCFVFAKNLGPTSILGIFGWCKIINVAGRLQLTQIKIYLNFPYSSGLCSKLQATSKLTKSDDFWLQQKNVAAIQMTL